MYGTNAAFKEVMTQNEKKQDAKEKDTKTLQKKGISIRRVFLYTRSPYRHRSCAVLEIAMKTLELYISGEMFEFNQVKIGSGKIEKIIKEVSKYDSHGVEDYLLEEIADGDDGGDILIMNEDGDAVIIDDKPVVVATWELVLDEEENEEWK
jgi:hypothetical protein